MSRVDTYLDGEIERASLSAEERAQADQVEAAIEALRTYVAARAVPDMAAAVMHQVESASLTPAASRSRLVRRVADALWTPRLVSFDFRPAYGILAAAVAILVIGIWPPHVSRPPAPTLASTATAPHVLVQFRLEATAASDVRLAGSFTNWQPAYALQQTAPGLWTITLPLALGVHDYAFVVDSQRWVTDPYAPHVEDGFGGTNSRLALVSLDESQL